MTPTIEQRKQEALNRPPKVEMYHDNFQNYKRYNIPPAQLVIADKRNREGIISPSLALETPLECY